MAKRVLVRKVYDDPIIIQNGDFGPHVLTKDYNFRTSGIVIRRDFNWGSGELVIDLNGHIITYGIKGKQQTNVLTYAGAGRSGNIGHFGIICPGNEDVCPEFYRGEPYDYYGFNTVNDLTVTVRNGTIQSGGSANLQYSDAVRIDGPITVNVQNVTCTVACPDSRGIYTGSRTGEIDHNTLDITPASVSNRHQLPAAISGGNNVHDNTVLNSLLIGILLNRSTVTCHTNTITLDVLDGSDQTNAFGIMGNKAKNADNCTVYNNSITNAGGRGLHIDGSGWDSDNNTIDTQENATGFPGQALKFEESAGSTATNETAIVRSDGIARATAISISASTNCTISGGIFQALDDGGSGASGIAMVQGDCTGFTIDGATVKSEQYAFESQRFVGTAASPLLVKNTTFERLSGTAAFGYFVFGSGYTVSGYRFVDCDFGAWDPNTASGSNSGSVEWTVEWTVTISAPSSPNAGYIVQDKDANTVASGTLDGNGKATVEIVQYRSTYTSSVSTIDYNDHTFHVDGESPDQVVTVDSTMTVSF